MSLLRRFSTIKIAGDAERIVFLSDFLARIEEAWPKPIRILGNGSNVLMDDRGLKGTVILTREDKLPEPKILKKTSDFTEVEISAGMFLPAICRWSQKESLTGCEYMIGVPGTLGGAVVQNAGANEQSNRTSAQRATGCAWEARSRCSGVLARHSAASVVRRNRRSPSSASSAGRPGAFSGSPWRA